MLGLEVVEIGLDSWILVWFLALPLPMVIGTEFVSVLSEFSRLELVWVLTAGRVLVLAGIVGVALMRMLVKLMLIYETRNDACFWIAVCKVRVQGVNTSRCETLHVYL